MRYNFSLEPLGRFDTPCMGCGRYYGFVGKHVCPARGETEPNCLECRLRGFTCSQDNKDMIEKLNALGVVFEYQLMGKYPPALYTFYGRPRRLSDEEVASVIEIQNPLYDVQLAEKYPGLFQDKYPQNPKMIRILGAKKEAAEAMQRDMDEQNRRDHQRENFPSTFNPLEFTQAEFFNDDMEYGNDDQLEQVIDTVEDIPAAPGVAFMQGFLPYLLAFDRDDRGSIIKLLIENRIPTGGIFDISDLDALLSKIVDSHGWKTTPVIKIKAPRERKEVSYNVEHVKSTKEVLQRLVEKGEKLGMRLEFHERRVITETHAQHGERMYGEVCNGDKFANLQGELSKLNNIISATRRGDSYILPLNFYHDKSQAGRQGQDLYPCNVGIPTCTQGAILSNGCQERIAMFPTFTSQCFSYLSGEERKKMKRWIVLRAMAHVLEPFKRYSFNGVDLFYQGRLCTFYPIPIFVSGDWQEYQMIGGLSVSARPRDDNFPDVQTMISGNQLDAIGCLDETGRPFQQRTEQGTLSVLREAQQVYETGVYQGQILDDEERRSAAASLLKTHSLASAFLFRPDRLSGVTYWLGQEEQRPNPYVSLPYSGFRWTDCCKLYVPDYLHTIQEGMIIRMLGFGNNESSKQSLFTNLLSDGLPMHTTVRKKINTSISQSSNPRNAKKIPATKFSIASGRILYGEEKSALASVATVACLADARLHPLIPVLEAFHEMDSLMHSRLYTESCIQKLESAIIKFQETFKSVADSLSLSCKFPKFHILPRFASVIRSIGAPIITSTSYQEATHKSLKVHHRHTNNSREHFQKQINDFSIIHDIIESFQKDSVMTSTRVSKQMECIATKKFQHPTNADYNYTFNELGDQNCAAYSNLVAQCPDMIRLKAVLRESIKQNCPNIPENGRLEHYCTEINIKVDLYNKGFLPFRRGPGYDVECMPLIGAINENTSSRQEYWQMIQVRAPGSGEEKWYAQFLCLAVVTGTLKNGDTIIPIDDTRAIVQWYRVVPTSIENEDLITRYTLYEIEKTPERFEIPAEGDTNRLVTRQANFVDSCKVQDILKPVFFQLHPGYIRKSRKRYYLNIDA